MGKKRGEQPYDEDKSYGDPYDYDPTYNGPLNKRSCTDIICLLLFLAFLVAWAVVGYIAFSNGQPARLISPVDSEGNHCGVDEGYTDTPYLFYFDITKCVLPNINKPFSICNTPQVCVPECPNKIFVLDIGEYKDFEAVKKGLICKNSTLKDSISDMQDAKDNINKGDCARWYLPSSDVAGHCVPYIGDDIPVDFMKFVNDTVKDITSSSKAIQLISRAKEVGEAIVRDLNKSWPFIIGGLALAMLLSLIYIILMRWFAGVMVWVSLIGVLVLLSYCVYASYTKYAGMSDQEEELDCSATTVKGCVDSVLALRTTWLVFLIASAILLAIILIMILFLRNRIRIAIALIGEASRAVGSVTSTLAFPFVPWLLQLIVIAWAVSVGLCLLASAKRSYEVVEVGDLNCTCADLGSTCKPQNFEPNCTFLNNGLSCNGSVCSRIGYQVDAYLDYMHIINIFGFFWGLFFMSAFGEMCLAGTFATWYWTFKKSDVPFFTLTHSILRTMRYHIGTLAFGSLILAICRMIRAFLEYLNKKLGKYDNAFVKAIMCCLRCFFWCLEKFIRFINRNAYIMCAIHGKNFCRSARDAFNLLMRNIIRVFVLDKVAEFLFFLGKLMITAGMVALSFYFFSDKLQVDEIPEIQKAVPELNYYFIPVIVIGIGSYFIASLFFGVYAMAVDTLFLCFLEDCERNDGSPEKPYFMSKQLMKILNKKNKKFKQP